MPTIEEIREQIDALGNAAGRFGTRSEVSALPGIIQHGEVIHGLTSGFLQDKTWLIVCTSRRLLFIDHGWFYRVRQLDIPLERINSFEYKTGFIFGEFTVHESANKFEVHSIRKGTLLPFVNAINIELERIRNQRKSPLTLVNVADQIRKLHELRREQIITDDEFEHQKQKLLDL